MTSAARPTWSAALSSGGGLRDGSSAAPTLQTCAKDQPGHLKLKMRDLVAESEDSPASKPAFTTLISGDSDEEIGEPQLKEEEPNEKDRDDDDDSLDSEDEEEDDDDEELLRELEKIKREREAERLAREQKEAESDPHAILAGNPLLSSTSTSTTPAFGVKRRWDDDVVFKNQARGVQEKPQKRFINDTTRSDFHRRFLDKFIR